MSGCGLGYMLLSNGSHSRIVQLLGVTTNGSFGSQTFGITSGTSGCNEDGAVSLGKTTEVFAEVNFDSLRRDMARGRGEYVETFASLLNSDASKQAGILKMFQTEYATLFPSAQTTPDQMLRALNLKLTAYSLNHAGA
jgi:hypothetical protein